MTDPWSVVADLDHATQDRLADVLETRGADPQQQAMRRAFLADVAFPENARVLEVGCGTGVLTRVLAGRPNVGEVVGVDFAPSLLHRARELAADLPNVAFREADGRSLPFADARFDVVVIDSTLCHVPKPERALAEAFRVMRPLGWLAVFDGDYATTTVALDDHDPLHACADAMMANSVHDRWLVRRLTALVRVCGFEVVRFRGHGFVETGASGYMLSVIDCGADLLRAGGRIGEETAAARRGGDLFRAHRLREPCRRQARAPPGEAERWENRNEVSMDSDRFDALARTVFRDGSSRRRLLRIATGGVVGALLGARGRPVAGACTPVGQPCSANAACCTQRCAKGVCCRGDGGVCTTGAQCCSGTCANGACVCRPRDAVCTAGAQCCSGNCSAGQCCPVGQTNCGGRCRNLRTDNGNCGTCGNECFLSGSRFCACGTCVFCPLGARLSQTTCRCDCPPGQANCGGVCRDLLGDPNNCGACGRTCPTDVCGRQVCRDGMCCGNPAGGCAGCGCSLPGSACNARTCCRNGGVGACVGGRCP